MLGYKNVLQYGVCHESCYFSVSNRRFSQYVVKTQSQSNCYIKQVDYLMH